MKKTNYPRIILFGMLFGIIGSLIWFTISILTGYQIGLIAILVGWLVGLGILFGSKGVKSQKFQILSSFIALICIFLGDYLTLNHEIRKYLIDMGYEGIPYFLNFSVISKSVFSNLFGSFFSILFWIIATIVAYRMLAPAEN